MSWQFATTPEIRLNTTEEAADAAAIPGVWQLTIIHRQTGKWCSPLF